MCGPFYFKRFWDLFFLFFCTGILYAVAMTLNMIESVNDLPAGVTFPDGMVAIDTETLGLNVHRDRLCLAQLADGRGNVWLVKFDGTDYSAPNLRALLADPRVQKLFHFARFDMAVFKHYLGVDVAPVFCTKIASKLTRTYTEKHGLKNLVSELLNVTLDKEQQQSDWSLELSDAQKKYAANDVIYLHELKLELEKRLKERNRLNTAAACFDFLPTRIELDLLGWDEMDIFAHR